MQTCSKCNAQTPDSAQNCENCGANLSEFSTKSLALARFQKNHRVSHVILQVFGDSCPACQKMQGAYPKDQAPPLPIVGCSHGNGCRCFYQPVLNDIYP